MRVVFDTNDDTVLAAVVEEFWDRVHGTSSLHEKFVDMPDREQGQLVAHMREAIRKGRQRAFNARVPMAPWPRPTGRQWMELNAPEWIVSAWKQVTMWKHIDWERIGSEGMDAMTDEQMIKFDDGRKPANYLLEAEAIGSRMPALDGEYEDDRCHLVMLDIDYDVFVIPSSTPGHHHLIFNQYVPEKEWKRLIGALARCGLIERGYAKFSLLRGESFLRLPWIRKGEEKEDLARTMDDWLDDDGESTQAWMSRPRTPTTTGLF